MALLVRPQHMALVSLRGYLTAVTHNIYATLLESREAAELAPLLAQPALLGGGGESHHGVGDSPHFGPMRPSHPHILPNTTAAPFSPTSLLNDDFMVKPTRLSTTFLLPSSRYYQIASLYRRRLISILGQTGPFTFALPYITAAPAQHAY
jgi:hypothetical protein